MMRWRKRDCGQIGSGCRGLRKMERSVKAEKEKKIC